MKCSIISLNILLIKLDDSMITRVEDFLISGIEVLLGAASFILGASYLSRVLDIYLTQGLGFNISAIIEALLNEYISLDPIPFYVPAFLGVIAGGVLIFICYVLMRDGIIGLMKLEKTQIANLDPISTEEEE